MKNSRFILFTLVVAVLLMAVAMVPAGGTVSADADAEVTLTLLHNSDGESALSSTVNTVAAGSPYGNEESVDLLVGGVASFKTLMDANIADAALAGNAVVAVYAGDAFLASSTIVCSLPPLNQPIYDAIAQRQMAYTAHVFGNHEFDFNPDFLEDFIRTFDDGTGLTQPFLSTNLDFSPEPGYADLIDADGLINEVVEDNRPIARSMVYTDPVTGESFGIVGATYPELATISSPRDVIVANLEETIQLVQAEIDALEASGVNKIIFSSHLQDLDNDIALLGELTGIDLAIGGGGDEILVNSSVDGMAQMLPGESAAAFGEYPLEVEDKDGNTVYLVTTKGNYKYLGRLDVTFDDAGVVAAVDLDNSYPRPNVPFNDANEAAIDALGLAMFATENQAILDSVIAPVQACVDGFETTIVAHSQLVLDVSRNSVRGAEANGGNLITDAFAYAYEQLAEQSGVTALDNPVVAVQNGGGIRQNAGDFLTGDLSRKNTLDILPFTNDVVVLENITPELLKEIMEFSVGTELPWGGFLQVSGIKVVFDLTKEVGSRVDHLMLADGTAIVENGELVDGAPVINLVTNNFTAAGGDGFEMMSDIPTIALGDEAKISYERALVLYLTESAEDFPVDEVTDLPTILVDDPRYQPGGEGRMLFIRYKTMLPAAFR